MRVVRSSASVTWPSLKMITALAPAAMALLALTTKSQVPRWISAMLPAGKPAKSVASHPLDELGSGVGGRVRSTGVTGLVTSPLPEYSMTSMSSP